MNTSIQSLGKLGEDLACKYLTQKGHIILGRNFQNTKGYKYGEVDIITQKNETIVFVEVKTRYYKQDIHERPEENISYKKMKNLEHIAQTYLKRNNLESARYQFDAVSILYDHAERKAMIRHLECIFLE